MDSKVNYIVVGAFVVGLFLAGIIIFLWMSVFTHEKPHQTYIVYVREDVTGLAIQSMVRYNGVKVGYVKSIQLDPNNPQLVKLILDVEEGTPITTSTVATLAPQGITGVVYVNLKAEKPYAPILKAAPGELFPIIPARPSLLMQLSDVLPEITKNVRDLGESVRQVFDAQNQRAIKNTLQHLDKFTSALSDNQKQIDSTLKSLEISMKNASEASKRFPQISQELEMTLGNLRQTSRSAEFLMRDSRVAVNAFSIQVLPDIQQMMTKLNGLSEQFSQLGSQLSQNPSIVIRGYQPAALGPGER